MMQLALILLLPFVGTTAGSACVFFLKNGLKPSVQRMLAGFAAGVMVAASIWSLLQPAMEQSDGLGKLAFFPAFAGFWLGILMMLVLDTVVPHLHANADKPEGSRSKLNRITMMVFAVTLHNIPEGMALGVVIAGWMSGAADLSFMGAVALSVGIAIQNFPEGAIVSMPLHSEGSSKVRAFWLGTGSGAVEPIAALITILLSDLLVPVLPYLLSFAAGAMMYVVVEELVPEMSEGEDGHTNLPTLLFAFGFTLMMALDVALG